MGGNGGGGGGGGMFIKQSSTVHLHTPYQPQVAKCRIFPHNRHLEVWVAEVLCPLPWDPQKDVV